MPYESVYDLNQIDLRRHGLIEASAGTGKTYTIENLVIRLLKERDDVELENILLVTFTEKAASELKIRIRDKLERELNDSKDDKKTEKKLGETLEAFDKASIYTIHGFCRTVLRDFAFENSTLFQSEVINDAPLFERLLKEQMRRKWPEIYRGHLKEILEISGFNQKKGSFLDTVLGLAKSFHEAAGDRLLPDLKDRNFQEIKREIASVCMEIKALLGSNKGFSSGFAQLNFNSKSRNSIHDKIVIPVEEYFSQVEEDNIDIRALADLMTRIQSTSSSGRRGADCLIPKKWNQDKPNPAVCPNLEVIKQKLEDVNVRLNDLRYGLAVEAIHLLQDEVDRTKRNHGWISYYDMLALVEKALHNENSSNLSGKLRNRFKVAFIDEFQDTDPIQWKIFKKIFIDNHDDNLQNLLFVIGDPKQAIYSFRGADVYAYLSAKNEMERLAKRGKAKLYSLSVNYRSQPEMITVFNNLFCREAWFKPQDLAGQFEIGYQNTGVPGEGERPGVIIEDNSGRPVLNIVDLSNASPPRPARPRIA
ncbi:MAG: UvrD-helicase domain-containing protein, partial [Deltaproteobacteria bacterium]|nr:UvrD-helicase domain-containing protein [Deltaproteobacteria bacterium]